MLIVINCSCSLTVTHSLTCYLIYIRKMKHSYYGGSSSHKASINMQMKPRLIQIQSEEEKRKEGRTERWEKCFLFLCRRIGWITRRCNLFHYRQPQIDASHVLNAPVAPSIGEWQIYSSIIWTKIWVLLRMYTFVGSFNLAFFPFHYAFNTPQT